MDSDFTVKYYVDKSGEWRWRLLADNNRTVAESGEGYNNLEDLLDIVLKIFPRYEVKRG